MTLIAAAVSAPGAGAALPPTSAGCQNADDSFIAISAAAARGAIACIVNVERSGRGLSTLNEDARLSEAARKHSRYQYEKGQMTHDGPGGNDTGDRIEKEGYRWRAWGENVAVGYGTPLDLMKGWLASEGHCENVLSPGFTDLGFGIATGPKGTYATQVFGAEPGDPDGSGGSAPQRSCPQRPLGGSGGSGRQDPGLKLDARIKAGKLKIAVRYDRDAEGRLKLRIKRPGKDPRAKRIAAKPGLVKFRAAARPGDYVIRARFSGAGGWADEAAKLKLEISRRR